MSGIRHKGYPGNIFYDDDGKKIVSLYCTQAVIKGRPYYIDYDGTYGPQATTPATLTAFSPKMVVALESAAINTIARFQMAGPVEEAYVADGAAVGDHLEVINSGTSFIVDGTTGSTSRSVKSCAMTMEANSSGAAALRKIWLFEEGSNIAAS